MEFALILPFIGILFLAIWAKRGEKWNKDKRVILYKSLMSKGCIHCHEELIIGDFSKEYLNVECENCGVAYQTQPELGMAWEMNNE